MAKVKKAKIIAKKEAVTTPVKEVKSGSLLKRILSAVVLLPVVIGAVYIGYPVLTFLLLILSALMASEWEQMTNNGKTTRMSVVLTMWLGMISVVWLTMLLLVNANPMASWTIANMTVGVQAFLMALPLVFFVVAKAKGYARPNMLLLGCYYMGVPMLLMPFLGSMQLLAVLVIVWLTDIGGMLFGKTIKGPKIFPKTSPGKTWAGSIGGVVLPMVAAIYPAMQYKEYMGYIFGGTALLSVTAQAGDYLESKMKRKLGLKDSGNLIPGHGGIFDRIDGVLLAVPVAVIIIMLGSFLMTGF